jgi:hypothetical protein
MGFLFPLLDDDNRPANSAENIEGDIFIHAVERVLPNLPKRLAFLFPLSLFCAIILYDFIIPCVCCSCIDKVKRLMS